ncbi:MAG: hypothetical protein AAFP22_14040, partial [Planctomycetota bacterium]
IVGEVEAAWVSRVALAGTDDERKAALASLEAAVAVAAGAGEHPLEAARARAASAKGVAELLEARAAARAAAAPRTAAQADIALTSAIQDALAAGDIEFVLGLGERAIAPLAALARASEGKPRAEKAIAPLRALIRLDAPAGLDVALELASGNDLLVKREVATSLNQDGFTRSGAWIDGTAGGGPWRIKNPNWLRIPKALLADPPVLRAQVRPLLIELTTRQPLPPALAELALSLPGFNPATVVPWNRPLFERMIESEDGWQRERAAQWFTQYALDASPVLTLADTRSRTVWSSVLRVLGVRDVKEITSNQTTIQRGDQLPIVDDTYAAALVALTASKADLGMRRTPLYAAREVLKLDPARALTPGQLRRVVAHETEVRAAFSYVETLNGAAQAEAMQAVLEEVHAIGRLDFNTYVEALSIMHSKRASEAAALAALDFANAPSPSDDAGVRQLLEHYVAAGGRFPSIAPRAIARLLQVAERPGGRDLVTRSVSTDGLFSVLALWDREAATQFAIEQGDWLDLRFSFARDAREQAVDWSAIALSAEAAPGLRDHALGSHVDIEKAYGQNPQRWIETALELAEAGEMWSFGWLESAGGPSSSSMIARLLDRGIMDPTQLWYVRLPRAAAIESPTAARLLRALPPAGFGRTKTNGEIAETVAASIRSVLGAGDVGPLELHLSDPSDNAARSRRAIARLLRYAAPEIIVSTARRVLDMETGLTAEEFDALIGAVGGLRSEEAVELLIEVGGNARYSSASRKRAMDEFEAVLAWREARARWEQAAGSGMRRDAAVTALVATLEADASSDAQRVEAVRGLGLLGAAEELPRLIGLLGDPKLGEAAQAAIDALHRSAAEKPKSDGSSR